MWKFDQLTNGWSGGSQCSQIFRVQNNLNAENLQHLEKLLLYLLFGPVALFPGTCLSVILVKIRQNAPYMRLFIACFIENKSSPGAGQNEWSTIVNF